MPQSTVPLEKIKAAMLAIQEADAALLGMTTWNQSNRTSEAMQHHRKAILALRDASEAMDAPPMGLPELSAHVADLAKDLGDRFHGQLHGPALHELEAAMDLLLRAKSSLTRAQVSHAAYLQEAC